jgi:CTP synthase
MNAKYGLCRSMPKNWKVNYKDVSKLLSSLKGILVAPGFGERGIEGKLLAIRYARESQFRFSAFAWACKRPVSNLPGMCCTQGAASTEVNRNTPHPVIDLMAGPEKNYPERGHHAIGRIPV